MTTCDFDRAIQLMDDMADLAKEFGWIEFLATDHDADILKDVAHILREHLLMLLFPELMPEEKVQVIDKIDRMIEEREGKNEANEQTIAGKSDPAVHERT